MIWDLKNWCARWFGSSPSLTPAPRHLQTSGPLWPLSLEKGRENNCSKRKQPGEANPRRSTAGRKQGQDDVSMSQLQTIVAFCFRMKSRYSVFKPLPRNSPQKGACLFFPKVSPPQLQRLLRAFSSWSLMGSSHGIHRVRVLHPAVHRGDLRILSTSGTLRADSLSAGQKEISRDSNTAAILRGQDKCTIFPPETWRWWMKHSWKPWHFRLHNSNRGHFWSFQLHSQPRSLKTLRFHVFLTSTLW